MPACMRLGPRTCCSRTTPAQRQALDRHISAAPAGGGVAAAVRDAAAAPPQQIHDLVLSSQQRARGKICRAVESKGWCEQCCCLS
jgi:hypothetical protein